jgi:predicted metal-dependent hydrolase
VLRHRELDLRHGDDFRPQAAWPWHSAEESEHKSTAFDLDQALGGNHEWRSLWFRRITMVFLADTLRQTFRYLRRDFHPSQQDSRASQA